MNIAAITLFIIGVLLIGLSFIIFFKTDCKEVFKDLRTTKKLEVKEDKDIAAKEIYYKTLQNNQKIAYNNDEIRSVFKRELTIAKDDTALLVNEVIEEETELLDDSVYNVETEALRTELLTN